MNAKLTLLQILSIILINIPNLRAECNVCSNTTQMACVSQTEYQFCADGDTPSGTVSACPTGFVCSTASSVVCLPDTAGVEATCSDCNKCDLNLIFACTGVSTFALCSGQTTPSAEIHNCPANQVCNINTPQICASSTTTRPTCPTTDTISTTTTTTTTTTTAATVVFPPTVPTYAQYFCQVMRQNKRFQYPTEFDNSCKRYIYCFRTTAGEWSGQIYTCAGSTYFDPLSLYCVADKPASC